MKFLMNSLLVGVAICAAAPACAEFVPYNPSKVMAALHAKNDRLKIITSHRGKYSDSCPENSDCAVAGAVNDGIESVEIDVRESQNGTLWPFHDESIGRVTNYSGGGRLFDPFISSTANTQSNPLLSTTSDATLTALKLRASSGAVTQYSVITLERLLVDIHTKYPNILTILDIKTASAVRTAAAIINRHGWRDSVLLKFGIQRFTPLQLSDAIGNLHFSVTIYAGDLDFIADNKHLNFSDLNQRVNTYVEDYGVIPGFVYYEVGGKQFRGINNTVVVDGPMKNLTEHLELINQARGNFVPVVEHRANSTHPYTGYYRKDGSCCGNLTDYLTSTRHFGNETQDDREQLDLQVRLQQNILTDDAATARALASRLGYRSAVGSIID